MPLVTPLVSLRVAVVPVTLGATALPAQQLALPSKSGSVRFLVLGDAGTDVANQMVSYGRRFPFTFAIMLGDPNDDGRTEPIQRLHPGHLARWRRPFVPRERPLQAV